MELAYQGAELESFAHARRWKAYVRKALHPYLDGDILELGAGIGETTRALRPGSRALSWTCVEPDPVMAQAIAAGAQAGEFGENVATLCGTLADLPEGQYFDTALYVDVLEHIEEDRGELVAAAERLRTGGRIVVLSPAYPYLYSEFDRAIGHFRRYSKGMLRDRTPPGMRIAAEFYLDGVGMLASFANRAMLRQAQPTMRQVLFWDRVLVPLSRLLDPLTGRSFGRSVVTVWQTA